VFISYARQDGEAFATALRRRLEKEQPEITLWQDRAQLEGGIGWWMQITEALDNVDFLVLVLTPAAVHSPVVRQEWRYARQHGVCVYPVKGVTDTELDYQSLPKWMGKPIFLTWIVSGIHSSITLRAHVRPRVYPSWRPIYPKVMSSVPG